MAGFSCRLMAGFGCPPRSRQADVLFVREQRALRPLPLEASRQQASASAQCTSTVVWNSTLGATGRSHGWIRRRVDVQWNDLHVRPPDPRTGRLREHQRPARGWHAIEGVDRLRRSAAEDARAADRHGRAGPSISAILDQIHGHDASLGSWPRSDEAAVTALLDRLLDHPHELKCCPRSWRTKAPRRLARRERQEANL
jgi:hypothetical protein